MENLNNDLQNIDEAIKETLESIDDIVNDVSLYGFSSIDEREIIYGITTAIGIDPIIDNILEVGCNIGEFYFYIERLLGKTPVGYYGTEGNEKFIDIARFRINESNTEFYNLDFNTIHNFLISNEIKDLKNIMDISVDWAVLINQLNNLEPTRIPEFLELFVQIPNKGLVITERFTESQIKSTIDALLSSETLKNKFIMRSDFLPGWYSFYFYNNR
jgi:hypothetical protein